MPAVGWRADPSGFTVPVGQLLCRTHDAISLDNQESPESLLMYSAPVLLSATSG
jgi:hypothetical protein